MGKNGLKKLKNLEKAIFQCPIRFAMFFSRFHTGEVLL